MKKVLVLGIGQSNFILQLYGSIKEQLPEFSFNISGLRNLFDADIRDKANGIFDEILDLEKTKWTIFQRLFALFVVLTKKYIYKELLIAIAEGKASIQDLRKIIIYENVDAYLVANYINNSDFDILHFHYIVPSRVKIIKYLDARFEIMSTFWGSDLLMSNGLKTYYFQSIALNTSRFISCATYDMGNVILSKFGRHLEKKIRYAKFIHDSQIYTHIDFYRNKNDWQNEFKAGMGINPDNKIFIIGHNATPANNHLEILNCFKALSDIEQEGITCVIPLTYGQYPEYKNSIKKLSADFKMQFVFLENYLSWQELAKLKLVSDVMIHMPTSDALSSALTEFFFAGGVVVTGSWLPYNTFSQIGLFYYQYPDFNGLKKFLLNEARNIKPNAPKQLNNIEIVRKEFDIRHLSQVWVNIFKELGSK